MVVTTVTVYVKPENIQEFIDITKKNHQASLKEPGNLRFDVARCIDDPNRFLLYEAYESEEASARHKETVHYLQWRDTVAGWMARPREGVKHNILFPADKKAVVNANFAVARVPQTIFGTGSFNSLAPIILERAKTVLLVTGESSLQRSGHLQKLMSSLQASLKIYHVSVNGEPSTVFVDDVVKQYRNKNMGIVAAIGGGSVLDAGKAISAMLMQNDSVMNYLEGVGHKSYNGKKISFIAAPTTAGTGSEATKNAVLSKTGPDGFKKSLRHDNLIPDIALIDPELTMSCPAETTAACGMDAFTQLLESYVSPKASAFTDTLAYNGISFLKDSLTAVCTYGNKDEQARSAMAYASWLSGITLANAGLGVVHGFASSIGGLFDIPHGVICATLLAAATKMNIATLQQQNQPEEKALYKYAQIGRLLSGKERKNIKDNCNDLIDFIEKWTSELRVPKLNYFGVSDKHIEEIINSASNKNNPVNLNKKQLALLLKERI